MAASSGEPAMGDHRKVMTCTGKQPSTFSGHAQRVRSATAQQDEAYLFGVVVTRREGEAIAFDPLGSTPLPTGTRT